MEIDRPAPSERLVRGAPTEPRPAASAIVLRDGEAEPEVLLVKRNPEARFMGGAWVFPGGAVQPDDRDPAATALRELREEAALELASAAELIPFSRWITPAQIETRFDTWFFVARAPAGAEPSPDGEECVDARWLVPSGALDAFERGELMLVFPTIKHLERLAQFHSVTEALDAARTSEVTPVEPRVVRDANGPRVVLPGEPGYGATSVGGPG